MVIYRGITEILNIGFIPDDATITQEVMQSSKLSLSFELDSYIKLEKLDRIKHNNKDYFLNKDFIPEINKSTNGYKYNLIFYSIEERFKDFQLKYFLQGIDELEFHLTVSGDKHLDNIIYSLGKHGLGTYTKGIFPTEVKEIHYQNIDIFSALHLIAETYETEWWIDGTTINIGKFEFGEPILLEYDKELDDISFSKSDQPLITRLYAFGSTRNIPADYRTGEVPVDTIAQKRLRLPDGTNYVDLFENLPDKQVVEGVKIFDDIYPRQKNKITEVTTHVIQGNGDTQDTTIFTIKGDNIFTITEDDITAGLPLSISFESGLLQGREFELIIRENNYFEIKYIEEGNVYLPNPTLKPQVNDEFFFFNFKPEAVLPTIVPLAEQELLEQAIEFMDKMGSEFVWDVKTRSIYCEDNGIDIPLGRKVRIKSTTLDVTSRVRRFEKNINNIYEANYQIGDSSGYSRLAMIVGSITETAENITNQTQQIISKFEYFSARQWRDLIETTELLQDAIDGFEPGINPLTVQTMQLIVGSENLQFRFVNNKTNPVPVQHLVQYDKTSKQLSANAGILQHMTIGINTIAVSHAPSEYKFWDIPRFTSRPLIDENAFYLYAKCLKNGNTGVFELSPTPKEYTSTHYYFLLGILNSEHGGDRSFAQLYGFTEVLPGRITTDKIVSSDGTTYFDLMAGVIGGRIKFLNGGVETDLDNWANSTNNTIDNINNEIDYINERNLLLDSNVPVINSLHKINDYKLSEHGRTLQHGEIVTVVIKGQLGEGKLYFSLYNSSDTTLLARIVHEDFVNGIAKKSFSWRTHNATTPDVNNTFLRIYASPKTVLTGSTVEWVKLVRGRYASLEWKPAPEDIEIAIAEIADDVATVQGDLNDTNNNVTNLNNYVNGAFHDGIITESEAAAIRRYINIINTEKAELEATYNKLYTNSYLEGPPKTDLLNAKINYFGAVSSLLSVINNAIADGNATQAEVISVNNSYTNYSDKLSSFKTAIEAAYAAIQAKLEALAEDYANEAVAGIAVGTGNMLRNTDFTRNLDGVQMLGNYSNVMVDAHGRLVIAHSSNTTMHFRFTTQVRLDAGKTYFFAMDEWWQELLGVGLNTGSQSYQFQRVKSETVQPESGVRVYYKITPTIPLTGRIEARSYSNQQDVRIKRPMLECATHPSDYSPAYEDTQEYINEVSAIALQSAAVTQGFTAINGGLITTIMLLLKNLAGMETAGISGQQGLTGTAYGNIEQGYAPAYWSGGTLQHAIAFSYLMWKIDKGTATASDWNMQMPTVVFLHNGYAKVGGFVVKNNESISMYGGTMDERFTIANKALTPFEAATGGTSANGYITNNPLTINTPGTTQLANTLRLRQNGVRLTFTATIMATASPIPGNEMEMQGSSLRVELYKNNVFIAELGQVTALNGTNSVAVNRILQNMGQGTYSIKLIYERGAGSVGSCSINTSRLEWDFAANSINRVELGTNGFMSVNSNSHIYYSGEKGLDYKGASNMPGVLLSASVNLNGGFANSWGAKKHATKMADKVSVGRYVVYHSIGHTSYYVTASPRTANRSCHIISKYSDNFTIEWRTIGSSIQLIDTSFDFQITGDNYTPRTGKD